MERERQGKKEGGKQGERETAEVGKETRSQARPHVNKTQEQK